MLAYLSENHAQALKQHQLHTFEQVWNHPVDWFEAPNERRGGWSGVGRLQLENGTGKPLCLFVKKQQNYRRFSWRHPFRGEPTFKREFDRLQYLAKHQVGAPKVVCYGKKIIDGKLCAILVTEELEGYLPLDHYAASILLNSDLRRVQKRMLLGQLALFVRGFHQLGLVHRALYPKHIFVKGKENKLQMALIDLEKSRFSPFFWYRAYYDLAAFDRHAENWTRADRLYFFKKYCQIERLGVFSKWLCHKLIKRAQRK